MMRRVLSTVCAELVLLAGSIAGAGPGPGPGLDWCGTARDLTGDMTQFARAVSFVQKGARITQPNSFTFLTSGGWRSVLRPAARELRGRDAAAANDVHLARMRPGGGPDAGGLP